MNPSVEELFDITQEQVKRISVVESDNKSLLALTREHFDATKQNQRDLVVHTENEERAVKESTKALAEVSSAVSDIARKIDDDELIRRERERARDEIQEKQERRSKIYRNIFLAGIPGMFGIVGIVMAKFI